MPACSEPAAGSFKPALPSQCQPWKASALRSQCGCKQLWRWQEPPKPLRQALASSQITSWWLSGQWLMRAKPSSCFTSKECSHPKALCGLRLCWLKHWLSPSSTEAACCPLAQQKAGCLAKLVSAPNAQSKLVFACRVVALWRVAKIAKVLEHELG